MAAKRKNCEMMAPYQNCTEPENFKYHCLINELLNATLEICAPIYYLPGIILLASIVLTNGSFRQSTYSYSILDLIRALKIPREKERETKQRCIATKFTISIKDVKCHGITNQILNII